MRNLSEIEMRGQKTPNGVANNLPPIIVLKNFD